MVHNRLLIAACQIIAQPLTSLFNKSLENGLFPESWKRANVIPIYKQKGEKSSYKNYRPISLLSCVGKLLEKCVQKHLVNFLNENNIITASQSGFTSGDSTTYQLLSISDDFLSALDRSTSTQAIFFDISKAFDKVWHRGLIHKLNGVGIRGSLLAWFDNYLKNRTQAVVINQPCSIRLEKNRTDVGTACRRSRLKVPGPVLPKRASLVGLTTRTCKNPSYRHTSRYLNSFEEQTLDQTTICFLQRLSCVSRNMDKEQQKGRDFRSTCLEEKETRNWSSSWN